jgi:hypothetical protein
LIAVSSSRAEEKAPARLLYCIIVLPQKFSQTFNSGGRTVNEISILMGGFREAEHGFQAMVPTLSVRKFTLFLAVQT